MPLASRKDLLAKYLSLLRAQEIEFAKDRPFVYGIAAARARLEDQRNHVDSLSGARQLEALRALDARLEALFRPGEEDGKTPSGGVPGFKRELDGDDALLPKSRAVLRAMGVLWKGRLIHHRGSSALRELVEWLAGVSDITVVPQSVENDAPKPDEKRVERLREILENADANRRPLAYLSRDELNIQASESGAFNKTEIDVILRIWDMRELLNRKSALSGSTMIAKIERSVRDLGFHGRSDLVARLDQDLVKAKLPRSLPLPLPFTITDGLPGFTRRLRRLATKERARADDMLKKWLRDGFGSPFPWERFGEPPPEASILDRQARSMWLPQRIKTLASRLDDFGALRELAELLREAGEGEDLSIEARCIIELGGISSKEFAAEMPTFCEGVGQALRGALTGLWNRERLRGQTVDLLRTSDPSSVEPDYPVLKKAKAVLTTAQKPKSLAVMAVSGFFSDVKELAADPDLSEALGGRLMSAVEEVCLRLIDEDPSRDVFERITEHVPRKFYSNRMRRLITTWRTWDSYRKDETPFVAFIKSVGEAERNLAATLAVSCVEKSLADVCRTLVDTSPSRSTVTRAVSLLNVLLPKASEPVAILSGLAQRLADEQIPGNRAIVIARSLEEDQAMLLKGFGALLREDVSGLTPVLNALSSGFTVVRQGFVDASLDGRNVKDRLDDLFDGGTFTDHHGVAAVLRLMKCADTRLPDSDIVRNALEGVSTAPSDAFARVCERVVAWQRGESIFTALRAVAAYQRSHDQDIREIVEFLATRDRAEADVAPNDRLLVWFEAMVRLWREIRDPVPALAAMVNDVDGTFTEIRHLDRDALGIIVKQLEKGQNELARERRILTPTFGPVGDNLAKVIEALRQWTSNALRDLKDLKAAFDGVIDVFEGLTTPETLTEERIEHARGYLLLIRNKLPNRRLADFVEQECIDNLGGSLDQADALSTGLEDLMQEFCGIDDARMLGKAGSALDARKRNAISSFEDWKKQALWLASRLKNRP